MKKTQTDHLTLRSQISFNLETQGQATSSLKLCYLTPAEFHIHQVKNKGKILGAIALGSPTPSGSSPDFPLTWVDMPLLDDDVVFEVWTSNKAVTQLEDRESIVASHDDDFLFGYLEIKEEANLDDVAYLAYCRIFDFIDRHEFPHLLRVWNYFPQINEESDGLERYRRFSIGRHSAFVAKGRDLGKAEVPAACALGSQGGPLLVYFVAGKQPGLPVENPRQISAYHYPAQYGPCSPTFSRAMIAQAAQPSLLFISGTASIVGHSTLHTGNVPGQMEETVTNIRTLLDQVSLLRTAPADNSATLFLKVYLREPSHLPIVQDNLRTAFGPATKTIYLQADICRADLLVEVEGVCLNQTDR